MPGSKKARGSRPRRQLSAAGYRWPAAVSIFFGIKCAARQLMLAAGRRYGQPDALAYRPVSPSSAILPAICGLGFGLPAAGSGFSIAWRRHRVAALRRALPAALDLMVLAIEAGQGLDAAILDTSRGLRITHPELASEFTQLQLELKANATRIEALKNFERSQPTTRNYSKFANLLIDTDRFGTSLGPALKTHARYLRIRFRQVAQEKARKVGVKLIFPIFFLIFPSVILVTLGPAVILLFTQMSVLMGQ